MKTTIPANVATLTALAVFVIAISASIATPNRKIVLLTIAANATVTRIMNAVVTAKQHVGVSVTTVLIAIIPIATVIVLLIAIAIVTFPAMIVPFNMMTRIRVKMVLATANVTIASLALIIATMIANAIVMIVCVVRMMMKIAMLMVMMCNHQIPMRAGSRELPTKSEKWCKQSFRLTKSTILKAIECKLSPTQTAA
jgi:hypothetical protein